MCMDGGIACLMESEVWNHRWLLMVFWVNAGEWRGLAQAKAAAAGERGVKGKRGGAG